MTGFGLAFVAPGSVFLYCVASNNVFIVVVLTVDIIPVTSFHLFKWSGESQTNCVRALDVHIVVDL